MSCVQVNPVIPETVNQIAFQVVGQDLTVTMASESGQLQLNVFEPVMACECGSSLSLSWRLCQVRKAKAEAAALFAPLQASRKADKEAAQMRS